MKRWKCSAFNVQFNASFAKYNNSFFSITVDHVTSQQLTVKMVNFSAYQNFHNMGRFNLNLFISKPPSYKYSLGLIRKNRKKFVDTVLIKWSAMTKQSIMDQKPSLARSDSTVIKMKAINIVCISYDIIWILNQFADAWFPLWPTPVTTRLSPVPLCQPSGQHNE